MILSDSFFTTPREQTITSPLKVGDKITPAKDNSPIGTIIHVDPGMVKIDWGGQQNVFDLNFFIYNYKIYADPNDVLKELL